MSKAAVSYWSMSGNTEAMASAVAEGLKSAGAEVELVGLEGREGLLKTALEPLRDSYDYIFIDCPPSLGLLKLNALTAADSVLVPIQCEDYALEGVGLSLIHIWPSPARWPRTPNCSSATSPPARWTTTPARPF